MNELSGAWWLHEEQELRDLVHADHGTVRVVWIGYADNLAGRHLAVFDAFGDHTATYANTGLMVYGPVDAARLRAIPVLSADPEAGGYPAFVQDEPPELADLVAAWRRTARARAAAARADRKHLDGFTARRGDEDPDAFYQRVAAAYRAASAAGLHPTSALADTAGVGHSTAAQWVARARQRGYLPPTQKGRKQA